MYFLTNTLRATSKVMRQSFWMGMAVMLSVGSFNGNSLLVNAEEASSKDGKDVANQGAIIGIDLGTTFSCVAVLKSNGIEIVPNELGDRTTPSYVAWTKEGQVLVGAAAKNQASSNPENTVFDAKRLMGREYNDPEIKRDKESWPFSVVNAGGRPKIKVPAKDKPMAPEEISAILLRYLKEQAEKYLGEKVTRAVITVPAYFNDAQRTATKDAGTIAGLTVERIINEPTAAAMAYGLDKKSRADQRILVYDLGGGTFDVSLLNIDDGVYEVKAVGGDTHLGGQDFDVRIMKHLVEVIGQKHKIQFDLNKDKRVSAKLRAEAEKAKRALSSSLEVEIIVDGLLKGEDFSYKISRARFEELNKDLFEATMKPVAKALEDARWAKKDVHEIVLVGGSTRIPRVQELLKAFFNDRNLNQSINPDEAVAYGAAVQAGVLSGAKISEDVLVIDVTPLTMGIETVRGVFSAVVPRNSMIPAKKTQIFSTASDNQPSVEINVFEGERPMAKDNHFLGKFHLTGIPLAPRGVPQIEVTFDIDANGILTVSAMDTATKKKESINITADKSRLSKEEIERMVEEAEKNRQADEQVKEKIEALSGLENYMYSIKSQLEDDKGVGSKMSSEDKDTVKALIAEKTKWMDDNKDSASKEDYEEQKAEIEKVFAPIISKLYQEQGGQGGDSGKGGASDHEEL